MFSKKYVLVLCLVSAIKIHAQNYKIVEVKKYFAENADRLDPIEGIWKRSTSVQYGEGNRQKKSTDTTIFHNPSTYMVVFKKNNCYVAGDFNYENEVIRQGCSIVQTKYPNQYVRTTLYYNGPNVRLIIEEGEIVSKFYYKQLTASGNLQNDSAVSTQCIERYERIYPTEKEIHTAQLNNPEYFFEEGVKSFQKKEYANAINLLNNAIRLNGGLGNPYYFRASCYYQNKNLSHALTDINTAIKLKNNSSDYYSLRGSINLDLKNFTQAISDFSKSIEVKPSAIVYYNRSIAEYSINDLKGAINDCNSAIGLSPKAAFFNQRAWYLFKTGDLKNGLTDASLAIRLDSKDANAYDTRGCIYFENNQHAEALRDFDQAIKLNRSLGNSYLYRGRIKLQMGQNKEACKDWNIAAASGATEAKEFTKKYCK